MKINHPAPYLIGVDADLYQRGDVMIVLIVLEVATGTVVEEVSHMFRPDITIPRRYGILSDIKAKLAEKYPGAHFLQEK